MTPLQTKILIAGLAFVVSVIAGIAFQALLLGL
jgi:hypothetical protein